MAEKNRPDWAISSQAPNRGRFNDYPGRGSRGKRPEMGDPKPRKRHGEDIVCALRKRKGARNGAKMRAAPQYCANHNATEMGICAIILNTTDLTGEYGDKNFILVRGDSRVTMTLPKDKETVRLDRDSRFLIDNEDSPNVLAYRLTKPFKLGSCFGGNGVLSYVLTECATEDTDNLDLRIPNYYRYFPRTDCVQQVPESELPSVSEYPAEEQERPGDTKVDRGWF